MIRRLFIALAILSLGTAAAWSAEPHKREIRHAIEVGEVARIEIDNLIGRVVIEGRGPGAGEIVAAVRSRKYEGKDATKVSQLLELKFEREGDRLKVFARYPLDEYRRYHYDLKNGSYFSSGHTDFRMDGRKIRVDRGKRGDGLPLWVDFHVWLPGGVDCDLRNRVGDVKLNDLAANCRVKANSGDVEAERIEGDLEIDTGSGDIAVEDMRGDLLVDTGSGDVKVAKLRGDFDADTGSGDVELERAQGERLRADTGSGDVDLRETDYPRVEVDTGSGDVTLDFPGESIERWVADTGSGDVIMIVPEGLSFHMELDTGSGDVSCNLAASFETNHQGEIQSITSGDGAGKIRADTGSGDVKVVKR